MAREGATYSTGGYLTGNTWSGTRHGPNLMVGSVAEADSLRETGESKPPDLRDASLAERGGGRRDPSALR